MDDAAAGAAGVAPPPDGDVAGAAERMRCRLEALHLQRQAASQQRREAAADAGDPVQDTAAFQGRMETVKRDVQEACARLRGGSSDGSGQQADVPPLDAAAREATAQAAMQRITELEQDAAQCAVFLPKYDLRAALNLVSTLRQQLDAAQAKAAPKKRFAFGARAQSAGAASRPPAQAAAATVSVAETPAAPADAGPSCPGIRHAAPGSTHVISFDTAPDSGAEYAIEDCTGCTITVVAPLRALRLRRLTSCTLLVVAVSGACYVEHCAGCRLHVACHQARIHDTQDTHLYLRCRSRPVIERCTAIGFAPLALPSSSTACTAVLAACALGDGHADAWAQCWGEVDDFGWHRAGHSPHWRVLEQDQVTGPPLLDVPREDEL